MKCEHKMHFFFFLVLLNIILNVRSSNNNGADQKRVDGFQDNQRNVIQILEKICQVL